MLSTFHSPQKKVKEDAIVDHNFENVQRSP